jgi:hypothetical protein
MYGKIRQWFGLKDWASMFEATISKMANAEVNKII